MAAKIIMALVVVVTLSGCGFDHGRECIGPICSTPTPNR